jgi:hypothetical protein
MAKNEEKVTEEVKTEEVAAEEPKKTGLYPQDKYVINLPLTSDKQDDVTVGINGKYYKIRRGEDVEVSAAVYEVLKNQERMDTLAVRRRTAMAAEMNKKLKSM